MARKSAAVPTVGTERDPTREHAGLNLAVVKGVIAREPHERVGADGVVRLSFDLRVRLAPDGPSELVPVAWPERTVTSCGLAEGSTVVVLGRIRQRFFRMGGATQSRTEIVAETVIGIRQQAAIRKALAQAVDRLTAGEVGQSRLRDRVVMRP